VNVNEQRKRGRPVRHGHARRGRKSATYLAWLRMHDRCYNPGYHRFHRYGGRGIKVIHRWHSSNRNGFRNFLNDLGEHPGNGYSLGRLDTSRNYTPHNTYWATVKQQANHQRRPLGRTGQRGVRLTPHGKYRASIWRNGKSHPLGTFTTPTEAADAYRHARSTYTSTAVTPG
jgi:hypothetical protein